MQVYIYSLNFLLMTRHRASTASFDKNIDKEIQWKENY